MSVPTVMDRGCRRSPPWMRGRPTRLDEQQLVKPVSARATFKQCRTALLNGGGHLPQQIGVTSDQPTPNRTVPIGMVH